MIEEVIEFIATFFIASILILTGFMVCACVLSLTFETLGDVRDKFRKKKELKGVTE